MDLCGVFVDLCDLSVSNVRSGLLRERVPSASSSGLNRELASANVETIQSLDDGLDLTAEQRVELASLVEALSCLM